MATTAGGLITAAFIKVGVESPTAAQTASALISLNNMVSLLGADGMMYAVTSESHALVVADKEYTIGPTGQWVTTRPLRVISCFLRDDDNYDWPVKIISGKDYNQLFNKSFSTRPTGLYFLPEYPDAKIIFNSAPISADDAYFEFLMNFTEFAATGTTVTLPEEYKEGLVYNLAVSLGEDWDRVVSKTLQMQAVRTREVIERMVASQKPIPLARFDFGGIAAVGDYGYSVVTDEYIDGGAF